MNWPVSSIVSGKRMVFVTIYVFDELFLCSAASDVANAWVKKDMTNMIIGKRLHDMKMCRSQCVCRSVGGSLNRGIEMEKFQMKSS